MGLWRDLRDMYRLSAKASETADLVEHLRREMTEWTEMLKAREERMRKRDRAKAKQLVAEDEAEEQPVGLPLLPATPNDKAALRAHFRARGMMR